MTKSVLVYKQQCFLSKSRKRFRRMSFLGLGQFCFGSEFLPELMILIIHILDVIFMALCQSLIVYETLIFQFCS